jgi:hypothetical protein
MICRAAASSLDLLSDHGFVTGMIVDPINTILGRR